MDYHVARNNEKLGVYPEAEAKARLQNGEILPSDLVWCVGMPAWRPAGEVLGGAAVPPPVAPPAPPSGVAAAPTPFGGHTKPANYLVWSILTTLFCCLPAGIVSIVFATQVDSKFAAGDFAGAEQASKRAKLWAWVSAGVGLVVFIAYVGMMFAFGAAGVLGGLPR